MRGPRTTREDDERLLLMVRRRTRGVHRGFIAKAAGVTPSNMETLTGRVLAADIEESTTLRPGDDPASVETEADIRRAYWPSRSMK